MTGIAALPRRALVLAACLAMPLVVLAYSWVATNYASKQGTFWDVPVSGYDPRDLLRGHYVLVQYQWPSSETSPAFEQASLCINGNAPVITSVARGPVEGIATCARGHMIIAAARLNEDGFDTAKLYIPQTRGQYYQDALSNPELSATLRVRIDDNGTPHPVSLRFKPRSPDQPATRDMSSTPIISVTPIPNDGRIKD